MSLGAERSMRQEELRVKIQEFIEMSNIRSKEAQLRESVTLQPKEKISGDKAIVTIKN